jgi:CBS domain-containing protein
MKVERLMVRNVIVCRLDDNLETAARIMWDNDCGCVPVVDVGNHLVGILTDRDICMAAYIQGRRLSEMHVSSAMSRDVFTCKPSDAIASAEENLRLHQVRRLPVVDESGSVVGILSLNDIVCEAERERGQKGKRQITSDQVATTLAAICAHRSPPQSVAVA